MNDGLGKKAEQKIKEWLDRPKDGYSFDRIPDQMSGMYGSSNICDFALFKSPNQYYIESKATYEDRFDFAQITDNQRTKLLEKSQIKHVFGLVIVLFATYKRAFVLDIQDVQKMIDSGKKSINIKKIEGWPVRFPEIRTIENKRKIFLDYAGEIEDYIKETK